ncbi:MAG: septum formation initiator family protein [Bacteroidales bacterium]|nr:septum formation initiator family protein [Bacteroidales bacterium]
MKFLKILKNRYVYITLLFLGYLLIFDQYNFYAQYRLMSELSQLEDEKEFYQAELQKDSMTYYTLFDNKGNLEKFARERFKMKKSNEDIFLIVRE